MPAAVAAFGLLTVARYAVRGPAAPMIAARNPFAEVCQFVKLILHLFL
jgi:hypothetical protein